MADAQAVAKEGQVEAEDIAKLQGDLKSSQANEKATRAREAKLMETLGAKNPDEALELITKLRATDRSGAAGDKPPAKDEPQRSTPAGKPKRPGLSDPKYDVKDDYGNVASRDYAQFDVDSVAYDEAVDVWQEGESARAARRSAEPTLLDAELKALPEHWLHGGTPQEPVDNTPVLQRLIRQYAYEGVKPGDAPDAAKFRQARETVAALLKTISAADITHANTDADLVRALQPPAGGGGRPSATKPGEQEIQPEEWQRMSRGERAKYAAEHASDD